MNPAYIYMTVIAPSCILLPVVFACFKYRILPPAARILFYYLIADTFVSIISSCLAYYHLPNTPLYHIATIIETAMLLYFFIAVFRHPRFTAILKWVVVVFTLLACINSLFFQHLLQFNSYTLSLQSVIIIALSFLYWWHNEHDADKSWTAIPLNWIISGLLLYFSSAFILLTFSNVIISLSSKSISVLLWNIHATLNILMFILISIGFAKYQP